MPVQKRETFGRTIYDFANSAFATAILAAIFNQYFATVVAGGEKGGEFFGCRLHGCFLSVAIWWLILSLPPYFFS
jgi:MFS-type transporter involved in bile tolerance (Atg22 family)